MKRRTISIVLMLMMIFSSFASVVLAEGEAEVATGTEFSIDATASETSVTIKWAGAEAGSTIVVFNGSTEAKRASGVTAEGSINITGLKSSTQYTFYVDNLSAEDGTSLLTEKASITVQTLAAKPAKPAVPKGLATYSAYNSVALEWKPVSGATSYKIYRNGKLMGTVGTDSRAYDNSKKMSYICKAEADKSYKFQVSAVNAGGESAKCAAKTDAPVKQMYIQITFRTSRKLTSHDGKKKTLTIPSGYKVKAIGYGMGKYHFYYKGYLFYVNYMSVKSPKALYTTKFNYSVKEAEYFVNTSKQTSMTNNLIWVNLYTQHLYIFKGKKNTTGKWRVTTVKYRNKKYSHWEVASGIAATPTPWGLTNKYRGKPTNIYTRSKNGGAGALWWNKFHSATALHGRSGNGKYGKPASHGCIRNTDERAQAIYYAIPLKSRVIVF